MARGQCRNTSNKTKGHVVPPETCHPTSTSPGYPNTPEAQENYPKSDVMKIIEVLEDENKSLRKYRKIHSNRGKNSIDPLKKYRKIQSNGRKK